MSALTNRMAAIIARHGETYTVGMLNGSGVFVPMSADQADSLLTATELAAAGRPLWAAFVLSTDGTTVGATLAWSGGSMTVQKAIDLRLAGVAVARQLILSP